MKENSIFIGYCHGANVAHAFMHSIIQFLVYDSQNRHLIGGMGAQNGLYIADNREKLARDFLKRDCEWFLSLDTDIQFAVDQPYKLLDSADKKARPVVGGLYFTYLWEGKIWPVWMNKNKDGLFSAFQGELNSLQPVDGLGMGFTLIHRDVVDMIRKRNIENPNGWTVFGHDPQVFRNIESRAAWGDEPTSVGEDLTFCDRVRAAGYSTWGNGQVRVKHLKSHYLSDEAYVAQQRGEMVSLGNGGPAVVEEAGLDNGRTE